MQLSRQFIFVTSTQTPSWIFSYNCFNSWFVIEINLHILCCRPWWMVQSPYVGSGLLQSAREWQQDAGLLLPCELPEASSGQLCEIQEAGLDTLLSCSSRALLTPICKQINTLIYSGSGSSQDKTSILQTGVVTHGVFQKSREASLIE